MSPHIRAHVVAGLITVAAATVLAVGWSVFEFDVILVTYAGGSLIALYCLCARFLVWAQRPPTAMIFRSAGADLRPGGAAWKRMPVLLRRAGWYFAANRFVWKRGANRWGAHWPIMIGCVMAAAIAFPLVFGWVWFETPADDFTSYEIHAFGFHLRTVATDSFEAFMLFHGLVWAAFPVIIGVTVALVRRWRHRGDQATQTFGEDIVPLLLLLAISMTGLLLTVSYSWLDGAGHHTMTIIHAITVIGTLIWLPFGKLFHIAQRSLKAAHMAYDQGAQASGSATCAHCRQPFASQRQIDDLITVEEQLGYRYRLAEDDEHHWQRVCPRCRRALLVRSQGQRWRGTRAELQLPTTAESVTAETATPAR